MKLRYKSKPWAHQLAALKYFVKRAQRGDTYGVLYNDMGSGKTKIMIDLINTLNLNFVLIVAPKKVTDVWIPEFNKHSLDRDDTVTYNVSNLSSDKKVAELKKRLVEDKFYSKKVIIVNYDSVWREPFRSYLLKLKLDCVVCDEMHRIKSPSSKCSRFLQVLGRRVQYRYGLTGTLMSQSPLDIYAQYRFIDETVFGTSLGRFQDRYANMVEMGNYKMLDKRNPFKNLKELREKMFSCAFRMESSVILPPTHDVVVNYTMSSKLEGLYKQLQKEGCLILDEGVVDTKNILSLMVRMQQIVNGYIPLEQEDKTVVMMSVDRNRQEALQEIFEGIERDEKIVVFCKYKRDIEDIKQCCSNIGRSYSEVSGKCNQISDWKRGRKNSTILIAQIQAGAEGIDLTQSRYCVYYDLHYSLQLWEQSRKRQHRPGQEHAVTYFTIIAKLSKGKSIDERIYESLMSKRDVIQDILEGNLL